MILFEYSRIRLSWLVTAALVIAGCLTASATTADVVVVANRADAEVSFVTGSGQETSQPYTIAPLDVLPLPTADPLKISFSDGDIRRQYQFPPDSVCRFARDENGRLDLHRLEFSDTPDADAELAEDGAAPPGNSVGGVAGFYRMGYVPVMILVDDQQRLVRSAWEKRYRERLKRASDILHHYCGMRFHVIAVGTWDSDDDIQEFGEALAEFRREVIPDPAALAIGFTSQHQPPRGQIRLGGIKGPLSRHLLVSEVAQGVRETERLEVLVHELGHFLGAVHFPDTLSAMRPILGDGRARVSPIRFDEVNTLVMYLVASELRNRGIMEFSEVSPANKRRLRAVYSTISALWSENRDNWPKDDSAKQHLALLEGRGETIPRQSVPSKPDIAATRNVVQAIFLATEEDIGNPGAPNRLTGDKLTEHCLRRAAAAAARESSDVAAKSFLLGLFVSLGDSSVMRDKLLAGEINPDVGSDQQRRQWIDALGKTTMYGRRDLAQHFVVSFGLTAWLGPQTAKSVGIAKEVWDSKRGTGFSCADLLADLSGIRFAEDVLSGKLQLDELAESFRIADYMPNPAGEEEGISWKEFVQRYGSAQDERFQRRLDAIGERILSLPKYQ